MLRITFISLFLAIGSLVFAQQESLKHTKMSVRGTSTMHDWKSEVVSTKGSAMLVKEDSKLIAIENLYITIKVDDLKSDKGSIMDNNTYKAMKSDKYPLITIKMLKTNSVMKSVTGYIIDATCEVSIAGITRKMNVIVVHLISQTEIL